MSVNRIVSKITTGTGKTFLRFRDAVTGRLLPGKVNVKRVTVGWNGVVDHVYRQWTEQKWCIEDDVEDTKNELKQNLLDKISDQFGSDYADKWRDYTDNFWFNEGVDDTPGAVGDYIPSSRSLPSKSLKKEYWKQRRLDK